MVVVEFADGSVYIVEGNNITWLAELLQCQTEDHLIETLNI
jgi:hypothetical protein